MISFVSSQWFERATQLDMSKIPNGFPTNPSYICHSWFSLNSVFFETPCIFLHSQFVPFPLSSSYSSLITEFPDNQPDTANLYCWSITWSSRSGERDILQDHQREHQGGNHTKHQQHKKDKKNSSSRFCPLQRPLLLSCCQPWPNYLSKEMRFEFLNTFSLASFSYTYLIFVIFFYTVKFFGE